MQTMKALKQIYGKGVNAKKGEVFQCSDEQAEHYGSQAMAEHYYVRPANYQTKVIVPAINASGNKIK